MKLHPSELFKILGVESRIRILDLLKLHGPLGAKKISEELGISPAAVSQHLKVMKQADLVKNERKGFYIPYSVDEETLGECRVMMHSVCRCDCGPDSHQHGKRFKDVKLEELQRYKEDLKAELKAIEKKITKLKK